MDRPHSRRTSEEVNAKQAEFQTLDNKIRGSAFTAKVPTREDAMKKVQEKKKANEIERQSKAKIIVAPSKKSEKKDTAKSPKTRVENKKSGSSKKQSSTSTPAKISKTTKAAKRTSKSKTKAKRKLNIQMSMRMFIALVLIIAVLAGALIAQTYMARRNVRSSTPVVTTEGTITIVSGMSARQIARVLEQANIVDNSNRFERYLELNGLDTRIQSGTFTFEGQTDYEQVAKVITRAIKPTQSITIFDGFTLKEIDELLVQKNLAFPGDFLNCAEIVATSNALPFSEGWFLSGQYDISDTDISMTLASDMHGALINVISRNAEALEHLDKSLVDIIIVSSMIQRETQNPQEMPYIADIIYRRMDMGMTLGIDATLRYYLD
ncbi:MAG: endolytic transglycosylase MltG, partial [Sphaerochaetaceae bacterium]|nr:endolytic transglycosylase MltG [Sphaerochaetaceae bacterium]